MEDVSQEIRDFLTKTVRPDRLLRFLAVAERRGLNVEDAFHEAFALFGCARDSRAEPEATPLSQANAPTKAERVVVDVPGRTVMIFGPVGSVVLRSEIVQVIPVETAK